MKASTARRGTKVRPIPAALALVLTIVACTGPSAPTTSAPGAGAASSRATTPAASGPLFGIVQPGDPIPAELAGLWRDTFGDWVWFLPPGDPYCTRVVHTEQTCHVFWNDATVKGKPIPWTDVITVVDGKLRFYSLGDQTCHGKVSTLAYTISGNEVRFELQPGSCFTAVSNLIRPGTGGQPDASAAPTLPIP